MRITLKLYGNLKKYAPNQKENAQIEIESGLSIGALLSRLGVPDAQVWMCAVNDTVVDEIAQWKDGDVLEVFEPVGGGTFERKTIVRMGKHTGNVLRII